MRKTEKNLLLLTALFVSALVTSNMVSGKLVDFGIATIPGGVVCYAATFLFSDVVGEVWGEEQANRLVKIGFASQCFASVLVLLAQILPAKDASVQSAYELLLGKSLWFTVAGLLAYVLSQSVDVVIFHRLKATQKSRKWLRNNLSTMVSQGIDTLWAWKRVALEWANRCFGIHDSGSISRKDLIRLIRYADILFFDQAR